MFSQSSRASAEEGPPGEALLFRAEEKEEEAGGDTAAAAAEVTVEPGTCLTRYEPNGGPRGVADTAGDPSSAGGAGAGAVRG